MRLLNWCSKCESYDWVCGHVVHPAHPNSIETRLASACFGEASANGGVLKDYVLSADGNGIGMAQLVGPAKQPTINAAISGESKGD